MVHGQTIMLLMVNVNVPKTWICSDGKSKVVFAGSGIFVFKNCEK